MGRRNYNAYEADGSGGGFRSDARWRGQQQQAAGQAWGSGYQGSAPRGASAKEGTLKASPSVLQHRHLLDGLRLIYGVSARKLGLSRKHSVNE